MINSERRGKEMLWCIYNSLSIVVTIYTAFFNIQEFCISPTRSLCVCVSLRLSESIAVVFTSAALIELSLL